VPSWDDVDFYGEQDSPAARYQAALDRADRERMLEGTPVPEGFRRPADPECPKHGYSAVDGLCGVCIQELRDERRAA
jgi:hypothetical protein